MGIEVGTAMLISALASGGAGIAGGLLGKKKTATSTSSTAPTLSPELQPLQNDLLASLQNRLKSGTDLSAIKSPAIEAVNRRYRNLPAAITSDFAGRGYGSSGVLQSEIAKSHGERIGALNDMEGKFAGFQIDQDNHAQDLATRLLASGRGSTSTGTQTGSGTALGSGISSGLETLTTLMTLQRMLSGGKSSGSSSSGGGYIGDGNT